MKRLSIIVPTLNEAERIEHTLSALQELRLHGAEVIVVDGGSRDDTVSLAAPWVDRLLHSSHGRANQMNAGAAAASGDVLLFLHADTLLPHRADRLILGPLTKSGRVWGRFDVEITGQPRMLMLIAHMMNWRSRLTGIATGDQAIFVSHEAFAMVGGFPNQPLMEDIAVSVLLKRVSPPLCLQSTVATSGRHWEARGIWRTILLMWSLRLAYFLGVQPDVLARCYR
ncbi:MAG: TIGR04283 family arsenosugar biosynthesis glycosyltransferase [Pseudogulbenkiania sp.]|nr:TIGR04283 family arsenosugar biosynthesis glycosyltransferase [Pseudogulbenkiania sp.]